MQEMTVGEVESVSGGNAAVGLIVLGAIIGYGLSQMWGSYGGGSGSGGPAHYIP